MAELKYFYRACFKPNQLDALKDLHKGFDRWGRGLGYAQAWHRANTDASPYCMANEFVCSKLGSFLSLPIPPFAITYYDAPDHKLLFSSLDFNFSRAKLPPILPSICMNRLPDLCAGVMAFDILIANEDRHDENLHVDNIVEPRQMHVYDHDQALWGGIRGQGAQRLMALRDRLGVTGGKMGGNRHVFLDELHDPSLLDRWVHRIGMIPEWFITDVCDYAAVELGISKEEALMAKSFLNSRKNMLAEIVRKNRHEFTGVTNWPEGLFQ